MVEQVNLLDRNYRNYIEIKVIVKCGMSEAADCVRVAVRVRPIVQSEQDRGCRDVIRRPNNSAQIVVENKLTSTTQKKDAFTYNYAFSSDDTQEMVYANAVKPIIQKLFDGYNATILAYGQTGSGKTHTMGTNYDAANDADDEKGIIPRCMVDIFDHIDSISDEFTVTVTCSFMELYQEQLFDLLSGLDRGGSIVDIRNDAKRGVFVPNLREVPVTCAAEAISCLQQGSSGRAVGSTAMNSTSSRSHAICTLTLQKMSKKDSGGGKSNDAHATSSKFYLVDLAGSERSKKTKATGATFKEGVKINQGLLALGNVISALGSK